MNLINSTKETRRVSVTLGGKVREIEITRLSPQHVWVYSGPVLVRVGRGTKIHTTRHATVYNKGEGRFEFGYTVICNRAARVFAWADENNVGNSGWTNNALWPCTS